MLSDILALVGIAGQFLGLPAESPLQGLQVTDQKFGGGAIAREGDVVTLHFVASTDMGKELASTEKRGLPYRFRIGAGEVAPFFDLVLHGMKEGGERKAVVPPELAYGVNGSQPVVPAKTTLVVEIRLIKVEKGAG